MGQLFLFYDDNLFIAATSNDVVFGRYEEHTQPQRREQFEEAEEEDSKEELQHFGQFKEEQSFSHRSLNMQGMLESMVVEDEGTPSFNFDEGQASFRSSQVS
jgi:hypothetical protein